MAVPAESLRIDSSCSNLSNVQAGLRKPEGNFKWAEAYNSFKNAEEILCCQEYRISRKWNQWRRQKITLSRHDHGRNLRSRALFVWERAELIAIFVSVNFRRLSAKYVSISSNERPSVSGRNIYIPMKLHMKRGEMFSLEIANQLCKPKYYPRSPINPNKMIVPGRDIDISKVWYNFVPANAQR